MRRCSGARGHCGGWTCRAIVLQDVAVLGDLPKLVWLRLSGNPIADVVPLGRLTAMRWLMLDAGTSQDLVGNHRPLLLIETGTAEGSADQEGHSNKVQTVASTR